MDTALLKRDVISQLWSEYIKTAEYKSGATMAIPSHFKIVELREKEGLKIIYSNFVKSLRSKGIIAVQYKERTISEWLTEWKKMHSTLFKYVLKKRGSWRKIDIRFGDPGDEDLHRIPKHQYVPIEMNKFAEELKYLINLDYSSNLEKIKILAKIHYQFVRIHPFPYWNCRIAIEINDQIAVFGLPVAMVRYPRHRNKQTVQYHKAIRACIDDPECNELATWINSYIELQLDRLA
jgi:hypothetical protein